MNIGFFFLSFFPALSRCGEMKKSGNQKKNPKWVFLSVALWVFKNLKCLLKQVFFLATKQSKFADPSWYVSF